MKEKRFKNLSNIFVAVISITLLLWMIIVVVKFDNHTKEVCKNIDQISLKNSGTPVDDSKVLEYYDSRIGTEGVVVAFISVIVTFLAFYIQYVFNKQQKKDISCERTENQLFHLMDVYRNICNTSVVDGGIMGKRTFHYMFYEYKAIFNLINDYIATTTFEMSIEDKNYLAFVFFMNGLTPNALPTYNNVLLDEKTKIKLLESIRELLYKSRENGKIIYLLDYSEKNITFADGHRPILTPYTKYVKLIIDFIVTQTSDDKTKEKYLRFLSSEMTDHEIGLLYAYNAYIQKIDNNIFKKEIEEAYKLIYKDLPVDIGYKFKFDDKDFFNRQKINLD